MLASLGNFYAYIFGWPVLAKLHIKLLYLCARALGMLNYTSNSISGETKAMRLGVAGKPVPVVFDVGANEGHWRFVRLPRFTHLSRKKNSQHKLHAIFQM